MVYTKVVSLNVIYIYVIHNIFIRYYLEAQIFCCKLKFLNFVIRFFFQMTMDVDIFNSNSVALNLIYNFVVDTTFYEIIYRPNLVLVSHILFYFIFQTTLDIDMVYTKIITDINAIYNFVVKNIFV